MNMSQITLKPLDDGQKAVAIPLGKTTIGRGPFLGCSDKKVSRNHAVLEVTSKGEVYLTPTHVNPCFYQPTTESPGQILKKDVPHKLENGDSFSLLPRAYRYQLNVVGEEKMSDQNDLNKQSGKTNGSTGDALEDIHKDPSEGVCTEEPSGMSEKPHTKGEELSTNTDKMHVKEDYNLSKKSLDSTDDKNLLKDTKEEELSPKENNVSHKEYERSPNEEVRKDKDFPIEGKTDASKGNSISDEEDVAAEEPQKFSPDKKAEENQSVLSEDPKDDPPEVDSTSEKKISEENTRTDHCEESRDEGTLDTLPSKESAASEGEEESSEVKGKPIKKGGRKKPAPKQPQIEKNVTKRKAAVSDSPGKGRGRKKLAPKFSFEPGQEGNSFQRVAGRTSSRTNRQTRQGLSLEDFIVSDDEEWQSDHSGPKQKRRKKRGSRKKDGDDSGSDWETEHKKPKRPLGHSRGSGSESGSDWGTPKKKGGPKGKRRKSKPTESEAVSEEEVDQGTSSNAAPSDKSRIPCTYGKKCYRRNQNHVEQFSHPGDSDYASEAETGLKKEVASENETESVKKECPYGANCFRKNAQHKKDFKHTKKVRPQREAAKQADKKTKGSKNSDEVDSYDLNDSFLNDDSADEYKPVDSGSDYESGERTTKRLAKSKMVGKGGKRGRKA